MQRPITLCCPSPAAFHSSSCHSPLASLPDYRDIHASPLLPGECSLHRATSLLAPLPNAAGALHRACSTPEPIGMHGDWCTLLWTHGAAQSGKHTDTTSSPCTEPGVRACSAGSFLLQIPGVKQVWQDMTNQLLAEIAAGQITTN